MNEPRNHGFSNKLVSPVINHDVREAEQADRGEASSAARADLTHGARRDLHGNGERPFQRRGLDALTTGGQRVDSIALRRRFEVPEFRKHCFLLARMALGEDDGGYWLHRFVRIPC